MDSHSRSLRILVALIFMGLGACGKSRTVPSEIQSRPCEPTGREKYTLHIDGSLIGIFENLTVEEIGGDAERVTFENGIVFEGFYLDGWMKARGGHALIPERHDVNSYALSPNLDVLNALGRFTDTDLVELESTVSSNDSSCLVVNRARFVTNSGADNL